jgi:RNA polymerase sigma-70 factor (ECF subfamily)
MRRQNLTLRVHWRPMCPRLCRAARSDPVRLASPESRRTTDSRIRCRNTTRRIDGGVVNGPGTATEDQRHALLDLYDAALPEVYGYLVSRCGSAAVAEDLTSETFLAAVDAVQRDRVPQLTVAWLVTVARNKLVDHWRRIERQDRALRLVDSGHADADDPWDARLDLLVAHQVLATLAAQHRGALTLRYLDELPVREVAACLGRTEGATEVLLVRARAAFRAAYEAATSTAATEEADR